VSWKQAAKTDIDGVLRLLLRDEPLCVALSSRLKDRTRGWALFVNADENGEARECFLLTRYGLLLPVLEETADGIDMLTETLMNLSPAVHSIMGMTRWVERAQAALPLPPTTRVEYHLMSMSSGEWKTPVEAPPGVRIRQAGVGDAEALFPLQMHYEKEEVILSPSFFNEIQCMRLLKESLRAEIVLYAEMDGRPVAKAGTNARGFGVDQIGGVFTVPDQRGKGLAAAVMSSMLSVIFKDKKAACLFVKKTNPAAISLYERLGFRTVGGYTISYYGY
jgi:predicted GNAT family acetyltransferase